MAVTVSHMEGLAVHLPLVTSKRPKKEGNGETKGKEQRKDRKGRRQRETIESLYPEIMQEDKKLVGYLQVLESGGGTCSLQSSFI